MGAWSEDFLSNDDAMDFGLLWDDFIVPMLEKDPNHWTGDRVFSLLKKLYFRDSFSLEDKSSNSVLLCLAALFDRHALRVGDEMGSILAKVINVELRKNRLSEWDSPRRRKNALESLLTKIGGKKEVSEASSTELLRSYEEFEKQFARWIKVVKTSCADEEFERLYPQWLDKVRRALSNDLSMDDRNYLQLRMHRLMHLAFYVGWMADIPDAEILALIKCAKSTKGEFNVFG